LTDRASFAVFFLAGIPLAVLGLIGGLIVMAAMLFAALLTWFTFGRMAFGGITSSLGLTWATVFVLAARDCAQPTQPCGATPVDMTPHIVIAVGLVVLGAAAALRGRAQKRDQAG
jgi:hypothetical protein